MTSDSLDWLAMALGATAASLEMSGPPELVEHLRDWAQRFNAATTTPALTIGAPTQEWLDNADALGARIQSDRIFTFHLQD